MLDSIALIVFPLAMLFAAFTDLLTMTIPNRLSLFLIGAYFLLALYLRTPLETIALHVSCAVAMLVLTFAMFQFRWIGGGDAKLAAATALWLGWGLLFDYGLIASIAGGALTLIVIALQHHELPQTLRDFKFIDRLASKNCGVPYGIALALAGLAVYPQTSAWSGLTGI
ncbi:A24 family peptidase [Methylocystis heyeri]|uniref:Peptidase n=1 Tax=Methylocystis heyeri TaxID=391905 RepID=A0A6B8KI44_9HYPH|nr:prepilin peptidase [Methylocystis heyeri]QGM46170.1 peptidase [Methylocystis heyeri]